MGQHQKARRSRLKRLRADRRKRHKKFVSTTTVSDFELQRDDDFSRYVEVWEQERHDLLRDGHTTDKTVTINPAPNASSTNNGNVSLTNKQKDQNRTILKSDKNQHIRKGQNKAQRKERETQT